MKRTLFVLALLALSFASCRKRTCTCQTDVYDSNYNYVGTTTEKHTVKAFTTVKALSECNDYETSVGNNNKYCTLD